MGLILFGGGPMTLLSGTQISFGAGLLRVVLAAAYLASGWPRSAPSACSPRP